jgi:hypothetical protein
MKAPSVKPVRCAIYTRVSTDHGLDQEFNSLDGAVARIRELPHRERGLGVVDVVPGKIAL